MASRNNIDGHGNVTLVLLHGIEIPKYVAGKCAYCTAHTDNYANVCSTTFVFVCPDCLTSMHQTQSNLFTHSGWMPDTNMPQYTFACLGKLKYREIHSTCTYCGKLCGRINNIVYTDEQTVVHISHEQCYNAERIATQYL
jgi:hypothetical protein